MIKDMNVQDVAMKLAIGRWPQLRQPSQMWLKMIHCRSRCADSIGFCQCWITPGANLIPTGHS